MYILGDFNCDVIAKSVSKTTKDLLAITSDVHLVHEATCITPTLATVLHLVFFSHYDSPSKRCTALWYELNAKSPSKNVWVLK